MCRDPTQVVSVQKVTGPNLKWRFNQEVFSNSHPEPTLVDATLSSNGTPVATVPTGPNEVVTTYLATPNVGDTWTFNLNPSTNFGSVWGFQAPTTGIVIA